MLESHNLIMNEKVLSVTWKKRLVNVQLCKENVTTPIIIIACPDGYKEGKLVLLTLFLGK